MGHPLPDLARMTTTTETSQELTRLAEPICEGSGYELVDLHYARGPSGWFVRVYIDRLDPSGPPISFADCERLSRELSAALDVEDPIPHAYSLEVSSPGVDRPLRKPEHFRRHVGQEARITLRDPRDGRKNFQGTLVEASAEEIAIEVEGTNYRLPIAEVASAKLVPDWDAILASKR
jgi:ribosome maturation factor RimP